MVKIYKHSHQRLEEDKDLEIINIFLKLTI